MSKKSDAWETPVNLNRLRGWARNGYTNEEIAEKIGVSRHTLYNWQKQSPAIRQAIEKGKETIDNEAEEALIKSALGFPYEESEKFVDGEGRKHIKTYTRYSKPDVTALIFWLKNRRPASWRNTYDLKVQSDLDVEKQAKKVIEYLEQAHDDAQISNSDNATP